MDNQSPELRKLQLALDESPTVSKKLAEVNNKNNLSVSTADLVDQVSQEVSRDSIEAVVNVVVAQNKADQIAPSEDELVLQSLEAYQKLTKKRFMKSIIKHAIKKQKNKVRR
ncbi:hypothetical protein [Levilactobacillus paucivorans]|uniref:hypothetical protein n=1 Tax=Levilactobacillus paucivorans TaxID=616990 RepID=UPI00070BAF2D|nr:hypothetical protein [Levilactobacillus paucivorans]